MCTGSPRLGVLQRLRPVSGRSVDGGPSPNRRAGRTTPGNSRNGSHVHCDSLDEGGAQLCPCGIATATPQHVTVASRTDIRKPARKFPVPLTIEQVRTAPSPYLPDLSRFTFQRTYSRWFLAYSTPSRSPNPHHLAVLARPGFVGAAPTLSGTSRVGLPPASPSLLRQVRRRRSLTSTRNISASWRTRLQVQRGGPPERCRRVRPVHRDQVRWGIPPAEAPVAASVRVCTRTRRAGRHFAHARRRKMSARREFVFDEFAVNGRA